MADPAPPQVRRDPAPRPEADAYSSPYTPQYSSAEASYSSSYEDASYSSGETPAYAASDPSLVCEAPQAVEQQMSVPEPALSEGPSDGTSSEQTETESSGEAGETQPVQSEPPSATGAPGEDAAGVEASEESTEGLQTPGEQGRERRSGRGGGSGRRGRGRQVNPRGGEAQEEEEAAREPLTLIVHAPLSFAPPEPIALPSTAANLARPEPPMRGAPDVNAEAKDERAEAIAARSFADARFDQLRTQVEAAHTARMTNLSVSMRNLIDSQRAARDGEYQAAATTDSTVETDTLAADAEVILAAQTARDTIQQQYRRARARVSGAKKYAEDCLTTEDMAVRAVIGGLATAYANAFLAEIDTFKTEVETARRFGVQKLDAYVRRIANEAYPSSTSGAGERIIQAEVRKTKVSPEAGIQRGRFDAGGTGIVRQLDAKRTADSTAIPPTLDTPLTGAATTNKTKMTESIKKAADAAYRALRTQRDDALEAIDQQEYDARKSLRTQRDVARETLHAQAVSTTARNRAQAEAAVAALDMAGKTGRPHLDQAMAKLRGTLASAAMSPPDRLRALAQEASAGAGASLGVADTAQRRQAEVIEQGAKEGLGTAAARAREDRSNFALGARERLQLLPTATETSFGQTIKSMTAGNKATASSVTKVGDSMSTTYKAFIGPAGADGSGQSLRDSAKKAENDNKPAYSLAIQNATKPYVDSSLVFDAPENHPAIKGKYDTEHEASLSRATSAYPALLSAIAAFESCVFFDTSEADAIPSKVRGSSMGEGRKIQDLGAAEGINLISRISSSIGLSSRNGRATVNWLRGNRLAAVAAEAEAAEGVFNDDEARVEAAMRTLSPDELRQFASSDDYFIRRGRDAARDYLGGNDLAVIEALLDGSHARADAIRFIERSRNAADSRTYGARVSFVESFTGAAGHANWGGQDVSADDRRLAVAREVARLRNPGADQGEITDQQALQTMADVASGTSHYTVRTRGGGTEERTYDRYRGAQRDLLQDMVLHGQDSAEARSARIGVAIETRPGRAPDMESLDQGLVDNRLNPNNYPPDFVVPQSVRTQALADRERMFLLSYERYGGEQMSTSDAEMAQARVREQLVERMGVDAVGARLVSGMVDEEWPSPQTAALAFEYSLADSSNRSGLTFRFSDRMSRTELDEARTEYRTNTGRSLYADMGVYGHGGYGEFSGKERQRAERSLRGMARTDQEKAAASIYAMRQQLREVGGAGGRRAAGTDTGRHLVREIEQLEGLVGGIAFDRHGRETFRDAQEAFDGRGQFRGSPEEAASFRAQLAGAHASATAYEGLIDHYAAQASAIITGIGILAAVVVTIATGGAASPLLMAAIAASAGVAGVLAKRAIRGGGYGWEEAGLDLALTAVDALTAGVGQALGLASRGGMAAVRTATTASIRSQMTGAVNRQIMRNVMGEGLKEGAMLTGSVLRDKLLIGAVTGGLGGLGRTAVNPETWREGASAGLGNLFYGTLTGAGTGLIGAGASHGIEAVRIPGMSGPLRDLGSRSDTVGRAVGSGVSSGISGAGGAFASTGTQLFADSLSGGSRADAGEAFWSALQEAGKGGLQGFAEGTGQGAVTARDQARVEAHPDLNELPGRRRPTDDPDAAVPRANATDSDGPSSRLGPEDGEVDTRLSDADLPDVALPEAGDTTARQRLDLGEGTAAAIDETLMRGDFAPEPIIREQDVSNALSRLARPDGAMGEALHPGPEGSTMTRRIGAGTADDPATTVRIRVVDPTSELPPPVARFRPAPDGSGMIVEVSNRAHPAMVERALAHELAEIRAVARDRATEASGRPHAGGDARAQLTPHERGRLAEFEVLARQIETERRPERLAVLRNEAEHLAAHLGLAGEGADLASRRALFGDALETPLGRSLLEQATVAAESNLFLKPVEGELVDQLRQIHARLERARELDRGTDMFLHGDFDSDSSARMDALFQARMGVRDGGLEQQALQLARRIALVPELVELKGRGRRRRGVALTDGFDQLLKAAPELGPLIGDIRRYFASLGTEGFPIPRLPQQEARYAAGRSPQDVSGLNFDPTRPLAPHALEGTGIDTSIQTVGALVSERNRIVDRRRVLRDQILAAQPNEPAHLIAEYNLIGATLNRVSEVLGEVAARRVAAQMPGDLREVPITARGNRMTDLVFEVTTGPLKGQLVVIEAKGGSSTLGYRLNRTGTANVQQGTVEYLHAVIADMVVSPHSDVRALGERLRGAMTPPPPRLSYHQVQQPVTDGGSTLPLPQHAEFDIGAAPAGTPAPGGSSQTGGGTAAQVPGSRVFHGESGPVRAVGETVQDVYNSAARLRSEGVASGRHIAQMRRMPSGETEILLDSGQKVRIAEAHPDMMEAQARRQGFEDVDRLPVAIFTEPDTDGVRRILVSRSADPQAIPRALAHELAEIRALSDRHAADSDMLSVGADKPLRGPDGEARLSPHDRGRLAELEVIGHEMTQRMMAGDMDGATRLREEAQLLILHLGGRDDTYAGAQRRAILYEAIAESSPFLALDQLGRAPPDLAGAEVELSVAHARRGEARDQELQQRVGDQAALAEALLADRINTNIDPEETIGHGTPTLNAPIGAMMAARQLAMDASEPAPLRLAQNAALTDVQMAHQRRLEVVVADLAGQETPSLGHLRALARDAGLPEGAVFDLHRQIRAARGAPPLSTARESLELFLWDIYNGPRQRQNGDPVPIYTEYARSRERMPMSRQGLTTHTETANAIRQRYGDDPSARGVRLNAQPEGDWENYSFFHAYSHAADVARARTTQRFYIRLDPDLIAPFFDRFISTMLEPGTDFPGVTGGKMAGPRVAEYRSESVVVYMSDTADLARIALALAEMGGTSIRTDSGAVTPMTEEVLPGIRWAQNPSGDLMREQARMDGVNIDDSVAFVAWVQGRLSFGKTRELPIERARAGERPEDFNTFLNVTLLLLREWSIDADNPSRGLQ